MNILQAFNSQWQICKSPEISKTRRLAAERSPERPEKFQLLAAGQRPLQDLRQILLSGGQLFFYQMQYFQRRLDGILFVLQPGGKIVEDANRILSTQPERPELKFARRPPGG